MSEDRLLSDSVRLFSERYPNKRGQLFHVSNERNNQTQAYLARSKGIFSGISDFLYFEGGFFDLEFISSIPYVKLVGIEIKVLKSRHKREHIEQQIEWAKILESKGGVWRLCTNAEDVVSCTELDFKGLTISDVELLLKTQKTKTIQF